MNISSLKVFLTEELKKYKRLKVNRFLSEYHHMVAEYDLVEEMATSKSQIEFFVTNLQPPIHVNLFVLLKWFNPGCDLHHLDEVDAFLTNISGLKWKNTKKPLKATAYQDRLCNLQVYDADNIERRLAVDYKGYTVLRTNEEIVDIINTVLFDICSAISAQKYISGRYGTLQTLLEDKLGVTFSRD